MSFDPDAVETCDVDGAELVDLCAQLETEGRYVQAMDRLTPGRYRVIIQPLPSRVARLSAAMGVKVETVTTCPASGDTNSAWTR